MPDVSPVNQSDHPTWHAELAVAVEAARAGAAAIMPVYMAAAGFVAQSKVDGSPVTAADLASDAEIRRVIITRFPDDGLLTEEGLDDSARLGRTRVWIADPLDGTAEFVARNGEFDVFVGLAVDGVPTVAAACHPPSGHLIYAATGEGTWQVGSDNVAHRVRLPAAGPTPRAFTSPYFGAPAVVPALETAVSDLGIQRVDVIGPGFHPRHFIPQSGASPDFEVFIAGVTAGWMAGGEWDAVVTDLIVREAGGGFSDLWGDPLRYNKPVARNIHGYVASVDGALHQRVLDALAAFRPVTKPPIPE